MLAVFVGEQNPYGADPYFALYPRPRGAAGDRLCRLVLGIREAQYLSEFKRVNLCDGPWRIAAARERAFTVVRDATVPVVLLGANVCNATGVPYKPFTAYRIKVGDNGFHPCGAFEHRAGAPMPGEAWRMLAVLPHPSGRNLMWNQPGAFERARQLLLDMGVLS